MPRRTQTIYQALKVEREGRILCISETKLIVSRLASRRPDFLVGGFHCCHADLAHVLSNSVQPVAKGLGLPIRPGTFFKCTFVRDGVSSLTPSTYLKALLVPPRLPSVIMGGYSHKPSCLACLCLQRQSISGIPFLVQRLSVEVSLEGV